jgi:hypothetical protein
MHRMQCTVREKLFNELFPGDITGPKPHTSTRAGDGPPRPRSLALDDPCVNIAQKSLSVCLRPARRDVHLECTV